MRKCYLPNIFTFANLTCGIFSILSLLNENYMSSCLLILLAAFIDRYDGRIARYFDVSSEIGKELDSLSDLVSFGVSPAILCFSFFNLNSITLLGYIAVALFPICGAFRLARYNISDFTGVFTGIPITVAGSLLAFYTLILIISKQDQSKLTLITLAIIVALSYLMISNRSFKKL